MEHVVKFCPCNFPQEGKQMKAELRNIANVIVVEEKCLNYCGQCLEQRFALVNGRNVVGDDAAELLEKIFEKITVAAK